MAYAAGTAAFYATFDKTAFKWSNRVAFALLWPDLFIANERFRGEFRKAVQLRGNEAPRGSEPDGGED